MRQGRTHKEKMGREGDSPTDIRLLNTTTGHHFLPADFATKP
jgi:hypothetical protein